MSRWVYRPDPGVANHGVILVNDEHLSAQGGHWVAAIQHNGELMPSVQEAQGHQMAAAPVMLHALQVAETFISEEAENRREAGSDMTDYLEEATDPLELVRGAIHAATGKLEFPPPPKGKKVFVLTAEHNEVPGLCLRVFATKEGAEALALSLVRDMVDEALGLGYRLEDHDETLTREGLETGDWQPYVDFLQAIYGAEDVYVNIEEKDVEVQS